MKKIKISFVFNLLIFGLTVMASTMMFYRYHFMGEEVILEASGFNIFKYFTVDSNILNGIISLLFAIEEYKLMKGKIKTISNKYYVAKLVGTVGVTLTFLTVFFYLGRISESGVGAFLQNSNLFLHLIIPVLSIITFVLLEYGKDIKFKHVFLGIVPMVIYGIYYVINILVHMENGKVSPLYDLYWFVQSGIKNIIIVFPIMFIATFIISIALWGLNKLNILKKIK